MGLIPSSPASAISRLASQLGHSRQAPLPCPWSASTTVDDCAKFQSWGLWGQNASKEGPIAWVDDFKTAPNGLYHPGKAGLSAGDIVLFDWDGNGVGNHTEMATAAPSSSGAFTTIGANGSDTIAVGYRQRSAYVLGYFRPAYGTASTGGTTTASVGDVVVIGNTPVLIGKKLMDSIVMRIDRRPARAYDSYLVNVDERTAMPITTPAQETDFRNLGLKFYDVQAPSFLHNFQIVTGNFA